MQYTAYVIKAEIVLLRIQRDKLVPWTLQANAVAMVQYQLDQQEALAETFFGLFSFLFEGRGFPLPFNLAFLGRV